MPKKLTADALWHMSRQPGTVIPREEFPGLISALKIKEALERELEEYQRLLADVEGGLARWAAAEDWYMVGVGTVRRDAYKEQIRKISDHLKEGL